MKDLTLKFGKYALGAFAALLLFISGAVTDLGQLAALAIDPTKAVTQAVVLLNETPKEVIVEAVKSEGKPPEIALEIKPDELPKDPVQ